MTGRKPRRNQTKARPTTGLGRIFPFLDMGMLLLGVGLVLSFSYLAWVILSGGLSHRMIRPEELGSLQGSVGAGETALLACLWLLIVVALVRHYKTEGIGFLAMGAGLVCWFGMPMLIGKFSPPEAALELQQVAGNLIAGFRSSGAALIVVGLLRIVLGRIVLMTLMPPAAVQMRVPGVLTGPEVPELKGVGGRGSVMRKCWELHFCRGSVRTTCPRYLESVACWRRRSGCYCDHDLAGRLMASVGGNASIKMQVAEELEGQQRKAQQLQERLQRQQGRGKQVARKICRECPIYLEHQKYKYRAISWLAYPVSLMIVALTAGPIKAGYHWIDGQAATFLSEFSFIPQRLTGHDLSVAPWANAENVTLVIVFVLLVAVMLQLVETAVYEWKL